MTPINSPFNWQGKSKVLDSFGRIKTDRQKLLDDATRVNKHSDSGRNLGPTNSETAPR